MSYLQILDVSLSALEFHRLRADLMAENIAHYRAAPGGDAAYRSRDAVARSDNDFRSFLHNEASFRGIDRVDIVERSAGPLPVHDPDGASARTDGFAEAPAMDIAWMMTNFLDASRAYEANVKAMNLSRQMLVSALRIGD